MGRRSSSGTQSWEYHTLRIRRLQRLQVIALALMCLGSILVAVIFGRVLIASTVDQRVAANDLRAIMDVRTSILNAENIVRRHETDSFSPLPLPNLLDVYARFRDDTRRLIDTKAGGDSPAAVVARANAAQGLQTLLMALGPHLAARDGSVNVTGFIQDVTSQQDQLKDALDSWMGAASDEYATQVDRGEALANQLFLGTITLMTLLGVLVWGWWVLLERARKKMTDSVGDSERRFRSLVQNSSDAVVIVGHDGSILYAAPPVEVIFGRSAAELLNTPLTRLVHSQNIGPMSELAILGVQVLIDDEPILWRGVHADGSARYLETVATNMLDDPAIGGVVLNTRDVSDRHQAEMELAYRANHDALTDLANRPMFEMRVKQVLERGALAGFLPAVLILDLDDFKTINDSLGHVAGDELLVEVGQRLRHCLRSVDLAARFGGDEFAVLLEGTRNRTEIETLARRLVEAISQPMMIEGRELEMQASIGIAIVEGSEQTAASLIRDADVAMYVAKDSGRAGYVVFDDSMSARASERLGLIADLRKAVERGQISLNYQSIVSLESGRITGLEALLRWEHPVLGWVAPTRFIELAEETGQIQTLGTWVFNTALDEMARLDAALGGAGDIHIGINVSMRQLEQENFAEFVGQALARTEFSAERVMIEITETALMRDPQTMLRQLQLLKRLGVMIAIDDFGTGYSSLSYLAHLPIDIVKIDRSFVEGIGQSQRDTRIANMIMRIGDSLSLDTIAEGVESYDQLAALQHIGCAMAQGFLFGKPAPMPEVAVRLRSQGLVVDLGDTPLLAT